MPDSPARKLLVGLGALVGLTAAGVGLGRRLSSREEGVPASNPLPPCPEKALNCYRTTRSYGLPAADVFRAAERAARSGPGRLTGRLVSLRKDGLSLHAVYAVGPFRDDLRLVVHGDELGSVLHVRSASRAAGWDLGVQRRRVEGLFDAIGYHLQGA
jgi:uncharacterized protein (DUF1499 family)